MREVEYLRRAVRSFDSRVAIAADSQRPGYRKKWRRTSGYLLLSLGNCCADLSLGRVNSNCACVLRRTGSVGLSHNAISRKIGKLFIERNNGTPGSAAGLMRSACPPPLCVCCLPAVNLHFDVLDTPEFFWEQDKYKNVYDRLHGYLELTKRVELLNKRLDIMKELLDMLADEQVRGRADCSPCLQCYSFWNLRARLALLLSVWTDDSSSRFVLHSKTRMRLSSSGSSVSTAPHCCFACFVSLCCALQSGSSYSRWRSRCFG
jgi:hypothetical protein